MLRIRKKRDEILSNDYQVCPRIRKKVDQAVTDSRDWRAAWDGDRKYVVSIIEGITCYINIFYYA